MEINKNVLNTIFEDESSSDSKPVDRLYIEITYFSDNMPSIKSYYMMSEIEYKDLKTLHMDLYLDDFINEEELSRDKLDIHIIHNSNNIRLCRDFLKLFGNPFDILQLIKEKKKAFDLNQKKMIQSNILLNDNFSDTSDENDFINENELSEPIIKPSNKKKNNNNDLSSDSESDDYIEAMTEIIETYNKSKKVDEEKIKKLTKNRPETLNDNIIGELAKTSKVKN
jgi:hypothetical protein